MQFMTHERRVAELAIAEGQMRSHRQEPDREWCRQRCEEAWPCAVYQRAQRTFREISRLLQ
jgi:hypothetical protein